MLLEAKLTLLTAVGSVVLHAVFIGLSFPIAAASVAPLHALACLRVLLTQWMHSHPSVLALLAPRPDATVGGTRERMVQVLEQSPPKALYHMAALITFMFRGLCGWLGVWGLAPELPQAVLGTAAVLLLLGAVWSDGNHASRSTRTGAWAVGVIAAAHLAQVRTLLVPGGTRLQPPPPPPPPPPAFVTSWRRVCGPPRPALGFGVSPSSLRHFVAPGVRPAEACTGMWLLVARVQL